MWSNVCCTQKLSVGWQWFTSLFVVLGRHSFSLKENNNAEAFSSSQSMKSHWCKNKLLNWKRDKKTSTATTKKNVSINEMHS